MTLNLMPKMSTAFTFTSYCFAFTYTAARLIRTNLIGRRDGEYSSRRRSRLMKMDRQIKSGD
eukprot:885167-Prorocentrum_minimum.AAC.3